MRQEFTFYLDWLPNVQFAGICWALDRGLYQDAGLNVNLVPWAEDGRSIVETVNAGGLCAGSAEDNLVVSANACGQAKVSALAAMFQQTPLVVMSRPESGIQSIADLRGKRVAMHCDGIRILEGMLDLHGISLSELNLVEVAHDLDNLLARRFDAVQGYAVTEPLELAARGATVSTFALRHPKLHPYAQVIFAPDALLAAHRQVYEQFLQVSFAGWRTCLRNFDQAAASIRRVGEPMEDRAQEIKALHLVHQLVTGGSGLERIGCIDPERWAENLCAYRNLGIVPPDTPLSCALDTSFWKYGSQAEGSGIQAQPTLPLRTPASDIR
ncbi:MAG: ABC transporter substrate-binding protein [Rhodobacteraceae bacterium]|nr:ABC transporter substrate-binding protein [Paracoccaceae bacterium]